MLPIKSPPTQSTQQEHPQIELQLHAKHAQSHFCPQQVDSRKAPTTPNAKNATADRKIPAPYLVNV